MVKRMNSILKLKIFLRPYWRKVGRPLWDQVRKGLQSSSVFLRKLTVNSEFFGPLRGYYYAIDDWLKEEKELLQDPSFFYKVIYPQGEKITWVSPKSLDSSFHEGFKKVADLKTINTDMFVTGIPQGRYWGYYSGYIISPKDYLISDLSLDVRDIKQHTALFFLKLPTIKKIQNSVVVLSTAEANNNYFHWMIELLPRVHLIERAGFKLDQINSYVINTEDRPYQKETLILLGIPEDKIVKPSQSLHFKADQLIVPALVRGYKNQIIPQWACYYTRNLVLSQLSSSCSSQNRRIYISRKKANFRRIENEEEITDLLESYGFEILSLESFSVLDQAALFSQAEMIVAPHGAGLTNLIFCRPETKILEVFSPEFTGTIDMWQISQNLKLQYWYTFSENRKSVQIGDRYKSMNIDREKFSLVLNSFIKS